MRQDSVDDGRRSMLRGSLRRYVSVARVGEKAVGITNCMLAEWLSSVISVSVSPSEVAECMLQEGFRGVPSAVNPSDWSRNVWVFDIGSGAFNRLKQLAEKTKSKK